MIVQQTVFDFQPFSVCFRETVAAISCLFNKIKYSMDVIINAQCGYGAGFVP